MKSSWFTICLVPVALSGMVVAREPSTGMASVIGDVRAIAVTVDSEQSLRGILAVIPADAPAAIVIPNLKSCSDELERCLEGMDRAELLMGARPLDQLKSTLGTGVAIDDLGGAALVMREQPGGAMADLLIVPVKDANEFLKANFQAGDEPDAWLWRSTQKLYARALAAHVVLGPQSDAVRSYDPGTGAEERLRQQFGDRGWQAARRGELILIADPRRFKANDLARRLPLLDAAEAALLSVDLDPLGMIIRGVTRADEGRPLGRAMRAHAGDGAALTRLPAKPSSFFLALAVDVAGLGGEEMMNALPAGPADWKAPTWISQVKRLQFAACPSPAGVTGGLLNDAAIVLETPQPEELKASIRQWMLSFNRAQVGAAHEDKQQEGQQGNAAGATTIAQWTENAPLKGGGTADAYEIRSPVMAAYGPIGAMVQSVLFGNAGWRGYVQTTADAVVITFSQRPTVLREALEAATAPAGGQRPKVLADDPVIRMMRQWMPQTLDYEMYLGVGPLMSMAGQFAASYGMPMPGAIPPEAANLDPIGVGVDVDDHIAESAVVIPASVLGLWFDMSLKQVQSRLARPAQGHGAAPNDDDGASGASSPTPKPATGGNSGGRP